VALQVQEIRTADDIPVAFEAGARDRADGLVITGESIFIAQRAQVSKLAAHYRLPAIYPYSIQVTDGGGLMSYDIDYP
jgi:putative ABC transport system substrate-binding protein